jgi:predicted dehydrogenase
MDKVRIGVIGLGNIGKVHAAQIASGKIARGELSAVCDRHPERRALFPSAAHFEDGEALLASGAADAVVIATPHYSHTTLGIAALERGLHVMVEKPISAHKADAERLIAASQTGQGQGRMFAAMFNQRTDPHYIKLRELVRDGELGEIRRINWIITNWFRTEAYYSSGGWRATWAGEGGGVLLNQCPHNLDLFQWIFGMPSRLRAFCGLGRYHRIEVEDDVTAYLEFPNGATGVFIASTGEAPGTNRLEVTGERGRVVLEEGRLAYLRNRVPMSEFSRSSALPFSAPEVWQVQIPVQGHGGQHNAVLQNFVDAILDGAPLIAPAAEGIHSVELANAMLYSSAAGETVELPLDGAAYERRLQEWIGGSVREKPAAPVEEAEPEDDSEDAFDR